MDKTSTAAIDPTTTASWSYENSGPLEVASNWYIKRKARIQCYKACFWFGLGRNPQEILTLLLWFFLDFWCLNAEDCDQNETLFIVQQCFFPSNMI